MTHVILIFFLGHNFFKYVMHLQFKPLSILVFYFAAFIALVALIVAFVVIKNPTNREITAEFSALFVTEWGI